MYAILKNGMTDTTFAKGFLDYIQCPFEIGRC
jgi:hypothetical protein